MATTFLTDKGTGILVGLEKVFPENKHMLCVWHMYQSVDKALSNTFRSSETKKKCVDLVVKMQRSTSVEEFNQILKMFEQTTKNKALCLEGKEGSGWSYFTSNWLGEITKKWAGHFTRKYQHFGCVSTQRVESGHRALKDGRHHRWG
ncbi:hypothetical protein INT47_001193 [Mucor saturninus]|uniref:MULE transposase domain-containing protein n=1 Tax=Mucor saturninus TaxID=64648 RepID=A0A8H7VGR6_9FUNG|nr:hypothetical protein INT47_001193 [Mucor saturninus]